MQKMNTYCIVAHKQKRFIKKMYIQAKSTRTPSICRAQTLTPLHWQIVRRLLNGIKVVTLKDFPVVIISMVLLRYTYA